MTKEAARLVNQEWVSRLFNHRLLEPIGYIPPMAVEANYFRIANCASFIFMVNLL